MKNNHCFYKQIKNFDSIVNRNKIDTNNITIDKNKINLNDDGINIKKIKRLYRSLMIRIIHVYVFLLITLVLCISSISLIGEGLHNFALVYFNDAYIIFGVAFGTFLISCLFICISITTIKKIHRIVQNKYDTLLDLMQNDILNKDISKYSIGIQMAFSSKYVWKKVDLAWNRMEINIAVILLFDELLKINK